MERYDVIIIGGGHGGAGVVNVLRQSKFDGCALLISDEPHLPYHRPPLSKAWLLDSMQEKQLLLFPESLYERANCTLNLGVGAKSVDPNAKTVTLCDGSMVGYENLVLSTGGTARRLPLEGGDHPNIVTLRNRADSDALKTRLMATKKLVVVGGGYIGLEVAASARKLGVDVTVLEAAPRLLARVTSPECSQFYADIHRAEGVDIRTNVALSHFAAGEKGHVAVHIADEVLDADLVVLGVGLSPDLSFANALGLEVDNGIKVDAYCQTSQAGIYAIGDNVSAPIPLYGGARMRIESVQNAADQAKTVVSHIMGDPAPYDPLPWFWSDQFDLKLKSAGIARDYDSIITRKGTDPRAVSFCYLKDGKLIAVDCINQSADFVGGQKLIRAACTIDPKQLAKADIALKTLLPKTGP